MKKKNKDFIYVPEKPIYTDPSEIKALRKYLNNPKRVRSEESFLEDNLPTGRDGEGKSKIDPAIGIPQSVTIDDPSINIDRLSPSDSVKDANLKVDKIKVEDNSKESLKKEILNLSKEEPANLSISKLSIEPTKEANLEVPKLINDDDRRGRVDKSLLPSSDSNNDPLISYKTLDVRIESDPNITKTTLIIDSADDPNISNSEIQLGDENSPELIKEEINIDKTQDPNINISKINIGEIKEGSISKSDLEVVDKDIELSEVINLLEDENSNSIPELKVESIDVSNDSEGIVDKKLIPEGEETGDEDLSISSLPDDIGDSEGEHNYVDLGDISTSPYDAILGVSEIDNPNLSDPNIDIIESPENNVGEEDIYNTLMKEAEKLKGWDFSDKVSAAVSSYLSSSNPSYNDLNNFKEFIDKSLDVMRYSKKVYNIPEYKLPEFNWDYSLNASNYIRLAAEKVVYPLGRDEFSYPSDGTNLSEVREYLLKETLNLLINARNATEELLGSNKTRLPGDEDDSFGKSLLKSAVSGGLNVKSVTKSLVNTILPPPAIDNPINRPLGPDDMTETKWWTDGNSLRSGQGSGFGMVGGLISSAVKAINRKGSSSPGKVIFKDEYLKGSGIALTLKELCGINSVTEVDSIEGLKKCISESELITTSSNITTSGENSYKISTLDSNSFWEVILEPYTGIANGYISFLPAFREINTINEKIHGKRTLYSRWVPVVGFELQKSKLNSRSINLFDGEINIPNSIEFTNELRLSIADDQNKSWKMYFEKCMETYVYNSEAHTYRYYEDVDVTSEDYNHITAVDKDSICLSPYKNVTFRCRIYVMNPQLSTIRKFDLLIVLKDIMEEFAGDIDSGGTDLSINFSIVGENPDSYDTSGTNPEEFINNKVSEFESTMDAKLRQDAKATLTKMRDKRSNKINVISDEK